MWKKRMVLIVGAIFAAVLAFIGLQMAAWGQAASVYGQWTVAGANPAWTGTMNLPGTAVPAATFATNSNTPQIATSAFLGASTPFGAAYGSSQNQPYLLFRDSGRFIPSTTTFTFAGPTPTSGWGFALGDIDADTVKVEAFDALGLPVPVANLGFQGGFNYCQNSPKPSSCTGAGPFDHVPTWNPATSTLAGDGDDTLGAAGWFQPSAPITTLRFTFTPLSGLPVGQLWFAANTTPPVTTTTTTTSTTTTTAPTTTTTAPATTTTTTPGSTSTVPTTRTTVAPVAHKAPPGPRLADTGTESAVLAALGVLLLAVGVGLARFRRRLSVR